MRLYPIIRSLHPKSVWRISRGVKTRLDNVYLALEQDGVIGYGEASPNAYFGEHASDIYDRLLSLTDYFGRERLLCQGDIMRIWLEAWEHLVPSRAAQCAVDLALWDLWAKLNNISVNRAVWGKEADRITTSCTLGITSPEEFSDKWEAMRHLPVLKVKMDARADLEVIRAIRKDSEAVIRVDANASWEDVDVAAISAQLNNLGVEFIEQPFPPGRDERMPSLLAQSELQVLADESCAQDFQVLKMPGSFHGFNIKLVKCGGLSPALRMLQLGKTLNLKVMVGCMLESSLLISAGLVVAQKADYVDLDGSWLIRDDPFEGVGFENGTLIPSQSQGFGVSPLEF